MNSEYEKPVVKHETPKPISAGGGVLYRWNNGTLEVLMIYRNEVWDLPKGKLDPGEDIRECARREVSEETGIPLPRITHDLGTTLHTYHDKHGYFRKTTWWYAMETDAEHFSPERKEGITKVCWVSFTSAVKMVGFDNLKRVLCKLGEVVGE